MQFNSKMLLILAVFSFSGNLLRGAAQKEIAEETLIIDPANVYESAKKLIEDGKDINIIRDYRGRSPLLEVAYIVGQYGGSIAATKRLISTNALEHGDPTVEELEERIESDKLIYFDGIKAINLLLKHGADLYAIDDDRETIFDYAQFDPEFLRMLNEFDELRKNSIKNALDQSLIRDLTSIVCDY